MVASRLDACEANDVVVLADDADAQHRDDETYLTLWKLVAKAAKG